VDSRKCQIYYKDEWFTIPFDHIKAGDVFRLFEPTGEPVLDENGKDAWTALSNPYLDEDGTWGVECE
jgi:hypothetical protein